VPRQSKVGNLQSPAIVDEKVGSFHIAMKNVVVV
jgi:hypothetical protein